MGPALSPAVHGARAFAVKTLPLHTGGLVIGGLMLGLLAAGLGAALTLFIPRDALVTAVGGVILLYAAAELAGRRLWRPNSGWQVPEQFRRTPYVGSMAFLWGVPLGFGWLTANITSAFLVAFLAMLAAPSLLALAAGVTFSLARATTLLLTLGTDNFDTVADRFVDMHNYRRTARLVTAVVGVALAAVLIATSGS